MTNKRKQHVRALMAKTNMSYQSAHNMLAKGAAAPRERDHQRGFLCIPVPKVRPLKMSPR